MSHENGHYDNYKEDGAIIDTLILSCTDPENSMALLKEAAVKSSL